MPNIKVTQKEIQKIVDHVKNQCKDLNRNEISLLKSEILSLVEDKDWVNAENIQEEKELKERAFNRIRFYMLNKLSEKGIQAEWKGNKYIFKTEINIEKKEPEIIDEKNVLENNESIETFSEFDNQYIPHREKEDVLIAIKHNERPLLVGPKGTGKSRMLEEIAAELGIPHIRIALGQVSDPADLIGTK